MKKIISAIFFFISAIPLSSVAQDSLKFISATTGAACYQVEYYNNHLFTGTGTTLRVYDVNGNPPFNMLFEYRFRSIILDLKVKNNFLYVAANHDGISKWDISAISNPVKLYDYVPDSLNEAANDIAFYGDTLFVAYYKKVGVFYDNGTSFQKLATFGHLGNGNGYISGGDLKDSVYAYTVARNTYSGTNPDGIYFRNTKTFSFISSFPQAFAAPEDVIFGKNTLLLHVMGGTQSTYNGLDARGLFYSLDISNINSPQLAFSDTVADAVPGLAIASPLNAVNINDTIYVATTAALGPGWVFPNPAYGQVYVYDATNPSNVHFLTNIYAGLWHFDVDINNKTLYVASEWYGIKTLDISNLYNEVDKGNTLTGGWAMKGDKYGNILILANEGYGIKKYDITNISQPVLAGSATYTANAPGFCQEVKFSANGNYVYGLFQTYDQFKIYDVSTLSLVGSIPTIGNVNYGNTDMLVWGNKVYLNLNSGSNDSLRIINVTTPSSPFIDTILPISGNDMKMDGSGKIFLCNNNGVYVYDITTGIPLLLSSHLFSSGIQDGKQIAVINDTIFVYVTWKGLVRYIYNSSLNTITEDATVLLSNGTPQAMATDQFGLYIAWTKFGLYSYRKQTMAQTSWYRTGLDLKGYSDIWPVNDLFCKDNLIFLNEYFGQITILSNDNNYSVSVPEISTAEISCEVYPNPSNGKTQVAVAENSGSISAQSGQYSLEIYNLLGEKVYEKSNEQLSTINSPLSIDLHEAPSGIYFLKISTISQHSIVKNLLIAK